MCHERMRLRHVSPRQTARHTGSLLLLNFLALAHTTATWLWLRWDNQPPLWDMALHQTSGLQFHDLYSGNALATTVQDGWLSVTGAYPPFYHHLLAAAFGLGRDHHLAVWANLPATLMLIFGTYFLGCRLFSRSVGLLGAVVVMGFPYVAWMSRESIIDYTLAAVVLGAILVLDRSEGFSHRWPSLGFGLLAALSALTKWIGPVFLVVPALWCLLRKNDLAWDRRLRNFLDATILGGAVTLAWYLPKLPQILAFLRANMVIGAAEGEPPVFSFQGAIYYLRLLEGEQIHGFFFLACLVGVAFVVRRRSVSGAFLLLWLAGAYLGLTLLRTKDPRFTLPYLPAVALLCVCWVPGLKRAVLRRAASTLLVLLSVGHFALVSFGWDALPGEVLIARGYQGSFSWDWRLYSQRYQGLVGPPLTAEWPQRQILEMLTSDLPEGETINVGVVPDLPRFNHENLRLEARLLRLPVEVVRVSQLGPGGRGLPGSLDFLIVSEGDQGMEWTTESNTLINAYVFARPDDFAILGFAVVPGGPALRIYRVVES
jgi:4-amino-4-deoxy-L-arabinose transferase-like glycosyltransferase